MNAEDREGIRRVEQLLRQHIGHASQRHSQVKEDQDALREEMRQFREEQKSWNRSFEKRQSETERKLAERSGMARAAVWIVGTLGTLGTIVAALFTS